MWTHIVRKAEHDLWSTIPPCGNVLGHEAPALLSIYPRSSLEATSQSKVADLQLAVGVDEEIPWLQVAMEDVGGMDILKAAKRLV